MTELAAEYTDDDGSELEVAHWEGQCETCTCFVALSKEQRPTQPRVWPAEL
jgi:hypothetical protein